MAPTSAKPDDDIKLAVSVIVMTVLILSFGDAVIKLLSANLVLWQIFVLRSCLALPILLFILKARFSTVRLRPNALAWTAVRSLMLALMWVLYYASLPHLQISIAAAAFYTSPLFITLFSARLGREPVAPAGWLAVFLGFVGVILVLKPTAGDFNVYALLPLVSAMLYALAMILTRTKCRDEHPLILSGALNVSFIAVGLLASAAGAMIEGVAGSSTFLSPDWAHLGGREIVAIALLGLAILAASIGTAIAYQKGPSSVVSTFDFAYVGFAVLWGLIFFGDIPDLLAVFGMILITAAGIIAVRR